MATTHSITSTYAGEAAGKYISAALLSAPTIANQGIEIMPNVKYRSNIQKIETSGLIKNAGCDFDPTSTVTQTERILEPKQLKVNLQLCKDNFRDTWQAIEMGYSSWDDIPKSFQDYLIGHVAASVAASVEGYIWKGDASVDGEFDGFSTTIALDANLPAAQEVAGTTVTASNVITELGKIVDAMPDTVYGKPDTYLYLPQNMVKAYVRALGGFGSSGLGANGVGGAGTQWYKGEVLSFENIPVFMTPGLASNTAFLAQKSNLFFGTGLLSDHNEVRIVDMTDIDLSSNVRFAMHFSAGVQYGNVEDIVTYGITNSAN